MDNLLKEYISWINENQEFYQELQEHDSVLFDRFMPVYAVLEKLAHDIAGGTMELDEDLSRIFTVGLEFLHDQFQTCKLYLDTKFHSDLHQFLAYDKVVDYILYIEDVRYELEEKHFSYKEDSVEALLDMLEDIIEKKTPVAETLGIYVDETVDKIVGDHKFSFYGIIDIFMDVAETIGLYLFASEDIVLGKDIE